MDSKGNTLLIVFIIISILTFLGISFNMLVSTDIAITQNRGDALRVEHLAKSGCEVALQRLLDVPEVTTNFMSFLRQCTIETSSVGINTDKRNAIGGKYPLSMPTPSFWFAVGDNDQVIEIDLNNQIGLKFIALFHDPETLGEKLRVRTKASLSSDWIVWMDEENPQGGIIVAEAPGDDNENIQVEFAEIQYGTQGSDSTGMRVPTKVHEIFGCKFIDGVSEKNFAVNLNDFSDDNRLAFVMYRIQGNRVLSTARLMERISPTAAWQTRSLASHQMLTTYLDNQLEIHSSTRSEDILPIKDASILDTLIPLSNTAD